MNLDNQYKYKFSIILATYNVEKYINDAIKSLIKQEQLNFQEDIQVIIVNDGSTDNVEEICLNYEKKYSNIKYILKENGGASSARNLGIKYIEGKYVGFLDPDDKYDEKTLYNVYNFFEENYEYIDVVSIPIYFFEGKEGEHLLNYKFTSTKRINLMKQYRDIQLSVASSFIKNDVIRKYEFNTQLFMAEDAEVMGKILLEKSMYGVVNEGVYWYRYRDDGNSAIQTTNYKKKAYTECLELFSLKLLKYALEKKGFIPEFIQYIVAYELRWRVKVTYINNVLDDKELDEFKNKLIEVLQYIDDKIIQEQKMLSLDHKIFLLKLKHSKNNSFLLDKIFEKNNICYFLKNREIYNLKNCIVQLEILEINEGEINLEGYVDVPLSGEEYNVCIIFNYKEYTCRKIERKERDVYSLGEVIKERPGFTISIPLDKYSENSLKIGLKVGDYLIYPKINFNKYVRLFNDIDKSYFIENGYCVVNIYNRFMIMKVNKKVRYGREFRFIQEILKKKKYKLAIVRSMLYLYKNINKRKIWVMMDRTYKADDNAEHLLRYSNKKNDNIEKYYVISNQCKDYDRLKNEFNLVNYGGFKHKLLLILADKVISSHTADFARNQFLGKALWLRNLQTFKFVFLQHGIIHNDASIPLNKYNRNINLFITSARGEYEEICSSKYYYNEKVVKLTGLPRYDSLVDGKKKQILIMPTWRTYLSVKKDYASKEKVYNESFTSSEYFRNYNNLINDQRLLEILKKYNYKILFVIHPELQQQLLDFERNEYIDFKDCSESYQEFFKTSSLMLTDYSSVAFDFAYLKKPVIYYQFDREQFFASHYKPGYFDYKRNGFGEVVEKYEDTVNILIDYIKNDCKIKEEYLSRINNFYAYTDRNNCERVYKEIIKN